MSNGTIDLIRIAIVAPTPAVRAGLRAFLAADESFDVLMEAADLLQLESEAGSSLENLDLIVASWENIPRETLSRMLENIGSPPALLVLTDNSQLAGVLQELPLRAWGLLLPDVSEEELSAAIHALHEGLLVNSPVLLQPVLGQMMISREEQLELIEELTARESEVLQLLAQGLANKQIALALGISEHTVKFHISSIYAKLGVTNRTEAVTQGARLGLIVL